MTKTTERKVKAEKAIENFDIMMQEALANWNQQRQELTEELLSRTRESEEAEKAVAPLRETIAGFGYSGECRSSDACF